MPLAVVCGQPCSGKSGVAAALAAALQRAGHEVQVVSEEGLHLERDSSYIGELFGGGGGLVVRGTQVQARLVRALA